MKKVLILVVLLALALILTACNANTASTNIVQEKPSEVISEPVVEKVDISSCYEITDPENQGDCILEYALKSLDFELCAEAGPRMDACYVAVAELKGDSSVCKYATREGYIDACYIDAAVNEKNYELCEEVSERQRSACYMNYAEFVGDVAVCDKVSLTYTGSCYQLSAAITGDVSVCEKIENKGSYTYSDCIQSVAINTDTYSYCTRLSSDKSIEVCQYNVAIENDNAAACNIIVNEDKKAQCLSEIA